MKLDILLQDLRYTFRTLSRDRGFTLVAILISRLGIAPPVFSVVNTLLLRPLPFPNSQQLSDRPTANQVRLVLRDLLHRCLR